MCAARDSDTRFYLATTRGYIRPVAASSLCQKRCEVGFWKGDECGENVFVSRKCVCVCVTMSLFPSAAVFHPLHHESGSRCS